MSMLNKSLAKTALAAATLLLFTGSAEAQQHELLGTYVRPAGEFAHYSGDGMGVEYAFVLPVDRTQLFSVRTSVGYIGFGRVEDELCHYTETAGCRRTFETSTRRSLAYLNVGPQLTVVTERVRPWVHAGIGLSMFRSNSSPGVTETDSYSTTGFDWTAGGGVSILPFGDGSRLAIQLGARYHGGSTVSYLPKGTIEAGADDHYSFTPGDGRRDVFAMTLGLALVF
jgi:opacity protein-like surface antigen